MIKKVETIDMVPDDIRELLQPEKGEYIAIGSNVYELKQFPVKKYFELLYFMSKYFTEYNDIYNTKSNQGIYEFFGLLAGRLLETRLIDELMETMFPEIPNGADEITYDQIKYVLGVIYKLNFLSQNRQIQNMEVRAANQKMMQMLGLNLMND